MPFKILCKIPIPVRVWSLLFLVLFFSSLITAFPAACALTKQQRADKVKQLQKQQYLLNKNRDQARYQINKIKKQENKELQKLRYNQHKLYNAQVSQRDQQFRLDLARSQLDKLEANLVELDKERKKLKKEAGIRIKQIYKGERLSLLHMILGAKNITSFLDNLYYQQRIIKKDKEILENLQAKTSDLVSMKENLKVQKEQIIATINSITEQKKIINDAVKVKQDLVNKLKHDRYTYEASERELKKTSDEIERQLINLIKTTKTAVQATGAFLRPVYGAISSPYGWRRHPIFGGRKFHTGVDIAGRNRSPIKAANAGTVIHAGWYGGYGKVVMINHGKSVVTLYAHLSSVNVHKGQTVSKGQVIGKEGSTGYSTGPHLHFEVRVNGHHTNPMKYIR